MNIKENKSKKICLFSFGVLEQWGGLEKYYVNVACELSRQVYPSQITVVTMDYKFVENAQVLFSIYHFKKLQKKDIYRESQANIIKNLGKARYKRCSNFNELKRVLNSFDVIYSKNEFIELVLLKALKIHGPKIIVGVHTPLNYEYTDSISSKIHNIIYQNRIYKYLLSDYVVKVQNETDKSIIEGFGKQHVIKIPHPIFSQDTKIINNNDPQLRVLFAGRLTEQKGVDILIKVIQNLSTSHDITNFNFKIAGSGEKKLRESLEQTVRSSKSVEYLGHIESDRMQKYYDWTDVVFIPSRAESLCQVAVEAALAGKIVVVTDLAGPREVIRNNYTGFLLPLDDEIFTRKLIELFELKRNNKSKFNKFGEESKEYCKNKFNSYKVYNKLADIL